MAIVEDCAARCFTDSRPYFKYTTIQPIKLYQCKMVYLLGKGFAPLFKPSLYMGYSSSCSPTLVKLNTAFLISTDMVLSCFYQNIIYYESTYNVVIHQKCPRTIGYCELYCKHIGVLFYRNHKSVIAQVQSVKDCFNVVAMTWICTL